MKKNNNEIENKWDDKEEYMSMLYKKCNKHISEIKKVEKIEDDPFVIPKQNDYIMLYKKSYNVQQLKTIAKHYKVKVSGNKNELLQRLFYYLRLSYYAIKIQKRIKGRLLRRYMFYKGPGFKKRELCNNPYDFFTMEDIKEMPYTQFFSYEDRDGFVYGFDIVSLYNLIIKSEKHPKNPYNRMDISENVMANMRTLIKMSNVLQIPMDIDIKDIRNELTPQKNIELRVLELFQNIDALGNYSNSSWFLSLNRNALWKLMNELKDIWNYRAQLSNQIKRAICPPNGDPFRSLNFHIVYNEINMDRIRSIVIDVLEKFVNSGIDKDSKTLGAYYVLGSMTLVSEEEAIALPWLFHTVSVV